MFVGRERELSELRVALDAAFAGDGSFVLLTGEPGIGKTTLANALGREATARGARVLRGGSFEGDGAPPYWPWVQILRAIGGASAAGSAPAAPHDAPSRLELRGLLPVSAAAEHLEPDLARFRLFDLVADVLEGQCAMQPLVVVLDDLQWADESSLLLLHFLARDLPSSRMMLLGAYRDLEARRRPEIRRRLEALACDARTVPLAGLPPREVGALVEHAAARRVPEPVATTVYDATAGNPLFVNELVRSLLADGRLDESMAAARPPVPERVRALIRRRTDHLSAACRRVLATAAVIGRNFDLAVLAHACAASDDSPLPAIDAAREAQIVTGAAGRFAFAHDLFREVLYDDLTLDERRRRHARVRAALELVYRADIAFHLAELAYHAVQAAPGSEAAIEYCLRAARRAADQFAFQEAVQHCQTALDTLAAAPAADPARRCEVLLLLGESLWNSGELDRSRQVYAEAADLAETLGLPEMQARAALGSGGHDISFETASLEPPLIDRLERALSAIGPNDGALRASLLARLGSALAFSPQRLRGEALGREAVALARRLRDSETLHFVLCCYICATWGPDNLDERLAVSDEIARLSAERGAAGLAEIHVSRIAHLDEAGDAAGALREVERYGTRTQVGRRRLTTWILAVWRATQALSTGRLAEAEALAMEALQFRDTTANPNAAQYFGAQLIVLRREQGRLAQVVDGADAFAADNPALPVWRAAVAWIHAELGQLDAARRELERLGAEDFSDIPRDMYWLACLWLLAETVARLGDRRRAAALYELLHPYRTRCAIVAMAFNGGSLERSLGLMAEVLLRYEDAVAHFEAALVANERIGARPWVAHTAHEYARALLARGRAADRPRALELLAQAIDTGRALGMTALLAWAEPLLAKYAPAGENEAVFRREGEYWTVGYAGRISRVRDARGLHLISLLLCAPGRDIPAADLALLPERPAGSDTPGRAFARELGLSIASGGDDSGPDARARAAYRMRLEALRNEADEAERFNDFLHAARAREEMTALAEHLGRSRFHGRCSKDSERARLAVTKAIRYAIRKVERAHPPLGELLTATVKTGTYCRYEPDQRRPIHWTL